MAYMDSQNAGLHITIVNRNDWNTHFDLQLISSPRHAPNQRPVLHIRPQPIRPPLMQPRIVSVLRVIGELVGELGDHYGEGDERGYPCRLEQVQPHVCGCWSGCGGGGSGAVEEHSAGCGCDEDGGSDEGYDCLRVRMG